MVLQTKTETQYALTSIVHGNIWRKIIEYESRV